MTPHPHGLLRGSQLGMALSPSQAELLYQRAVLGSLKDAAAACDMLPGTAHGTSADTIAKLGAADIIEAFRLVGWLKPVRLP